jgi:ferredoxin
VADRHPALATELRVDSARCTGHGRCYNAAPNLLSDDEEGLVTLRGAAVPIADGQLADAEEAVAACPEHAITLGRSS